MLAFGGGHIAGAINIGDRPELSVWAGDMLSDKKPILLVVEDETQLDWILWHFAYVGLTNFTGYLAVLTNLLFYGDPDFDRRRLADLS